MPRFVKTYGKRKTRIIKSTGTWLSPDVISDSGNVFSSPDVDQSLIESPPSIEKERRNVFSFGVGSKLAANKSKSRRAKPTSFSAFFDQPDEDKENLIPAKGIFSAPESSSRKSKNKQTNDTHNTRRRNNTSDSSSSSEKLLQKSGKKRHLSRHPRKLRQDDGPLHELRKQTLPSSSSSGGSSSSWHPSGIDTTGSSSKSCDLSDISEFIPGGESGEQRDLKTGTPEAKRARNQRNTRQRSKNVKETSRMVGRQVKDTTSTPVSVYHSAYSSNVSPVLFDASMDEVVADEGLIGRISEEEEELVDSVFEDIASISRNLDLMNFEDDTDPLLYKTCPGEIPSKRTGSKKGASCKQRSLRSSKVKDLSSSSKGRPDRSETSLAQKVLKDSDKKKGNRINATYIIRKRRNHEENSSWISGTENSPSRDDLQCISREDENLSVNSSTEKHGTDHFSNGDEQLGISVDGSKGSSRLQGRDHSSIRGKHSGTSADASLGSSELFGSSHSSEAAEQSNLTNDSFGRNTGTSKASTRASEELDAHETTSLRSSKVTEGLVKSMERLLPCSVVLQKVSPCELSTPPRAKQISRLLTDSDGSFKDSLTPTKERKTGRIITARSKVLQQCQQTEPLPFAEFLTGEELSKMVKVGEGAYGEVFLTVNACGESVALKIIPVEGNFPVNDEPQKTFEEILPEIVISRELSSMQSGQVNQTHNFIKVNRVACLKGSYPKGLLLEWDAYDERKGSENERPDMFDKNQLFILFEFADGGRDLEELELPNVAQAVSILQQVAGALAAAECQYSFEHRDLHWGNILIRKTKKSKVLFRIGGDSFEVKSHGVEVSIIDFTLSRLEKESCTVFCDLASDATLFIGRGDYQFDIYRKMKKENRNEWETYNPHSNVLWLHYVLEKLTKHKTYVTKPSKETMRELKTFGRHLLSYTSAEEVLRESELLQLLDGIS